MINEGFKKRYCESNNISMCDYTDEPYCPGTCNWALNDSDKYEFGLNEERIKTLDRLKSIRQNFKKEGKNVVWTNGCFDILHQGHVDYLRKAKALGDYLIAGLNSDVSVRYLKGIGRPINSEFKRANKLCLLDFVDYVTIFGETDVMNCLEKLEPDIYVKGGDYNIDTINQTERKLVEDYGGKIEIIPKVHDTFTTMILSGTKN